MSNINEIVYEAIYEHIDWIKIYENHQELVQQFNKIQQGINQRLEGLHQILDNCKYSSLVQIGIGGEPNQHS